MEQLEALIKLKELSPLAQLTLERLVSGEVGTRGLLNRRVKAKKVGNVKEFFDIGLALYLFTEIYKIEDVSKNCK